MAKYKQVGCDRQIVLLAMVAHFYQFNPEQRTFRKWRESRGWTISQASQALGIGDKKATKLEAGQEPSLTLRLAMSAAGVAPPFGIDKI